MNIDQSLTSAAEKDQDRRDSPRYSMPGTVFLSLDDGTRKKIGKVRDISLHGCFVDSEEDLALEQAVKLQFQIGADFQISGQIRRKDKKGFAVSFDGEGTA